MLETISRPNNQLLPDGDQVRSIVHSVEPFDGFYGRRKLFRQTEQSVAGDNRVGGGSVLCGRVEVVIKVVKWEQPRIAARTVGDDLCMGRNIFFLQLERPAKIGAQIGYGLNLNVRISGFQAQIRLLDYLDADRTLIHLSILQTLKLRCTPGVKAPVLLQIGTQLINSAVTGDTKVHRNIASVAGIGEILDVVDLSASGRVMKDDPDHCPRSVAEVLGCICSVDIHANVSPYFVGRMPTCSAIPIGLSFRLPSYPEFLLRYQLWAACLPAE
jgi:hypothetical protein